MRKSGTTFTSIYEGRTTTKNTNELMVKGEFTIKEWTFIKLRDGSCYTAIVTNEEPNVVYNVPERLGKDIQADDTYSTTKKYVIEQLTAKQTGRKFFVICEK